MPDSTRIVAREAVGAASSLLRQSGKFQVSLCHESHTVTAHTESGSMGCLAAGSVRLQSWQLAESAYSAYYCCLDSDWAALVKALQHLFSVPVALSLNSGVD